MTKEKKRKHVDKYIVRMAIRWGKRIYNPGEVFEVVVSDLVDTQKSMLGLYRKRRILVPLGEKGDPMYAKILVKG